MAYSSVIQILKLNEPRSGRSAKTGKDWVMQEAECILIDGDGQVSQVGVLDVPRELIGSIQPGQYMASFTLQAHYQTRKIGAQLTELRPMPKATPAASSKG